MENVSAQARSRLQEFVSEGTPSDVLDRYASLESLSEELDFGALDRDVVVLDTETTGLSFAHDELIQIAAARMDQGRIIEWFVTFVNPGKQISEEISHLTGISNEDVANAPAPEQALSDLVAFVGASKVVAHNADFDRTFTTKHPAGLPLLENAWIDSLDLSRIALPRLKSHRLIDLVKAFDAPLSTHRADADVEATCALYRILLAAVSCMPRSLVKAIASMATDESWPIRTVFAALAESMPSDSRDGDRLSVPASAAGAPDTSSPAQNEAFFSVRTLRRRRVNSIEKLRPKVDAESLAADSERGLSFPTEEEISRAFSGEGLLGSIYPSYEPRAEQLEMAQAIRACFDSSDNLVVEAGTGVGKSMGYLVPSALSALRNNVTFGIATNTNALLDQLVYSELPALATALAKEDSAAPSLTYAALKGISHYPCLRKVNRLASDGPGLCDVAGREISQAPALAAVLSYIEQSEFDDLDSLKIDYRLLPRYQITSTSNECLRKKCPFFGSLCFGHGARRRAEASHVVVTNHALLFCDLAAEGMLLPPIRYWVVDEAHSAEPEVRRAFARSVGVEGLLGISSSVSAAAGGRNLFARVEKRVKPADENTTLFYALVAKGRAAGEDFARAAQEFASHIKDLLYFDTAKQGRSYEYVDVWLNEQVRSSSVFKDLAGFATEFIAKADAFVKVAQDLIAFLEGIDEAAEVQREIASHVLELREMRDAAALIFDQGDDEYVYQASLNRRKDKVADSLEAALYDVGTKLDETLFARSHSVVFASATLTVDGKFDAFTASMGLNRDENSHARVLELGSSFDFDNNMIVYVASDMPEPNEPAYLKSLQSLLVEAHRAQGGSMLTLFTNRREMERCFDEVQPLLRQDDLRLVCQKWGVSVKGLRDDFIADESLSLFALKSFWQGFDAPGSTLRGVVIPKLPFSKPSDPLSCERAARDDRAWMRYVLPQAVIETKQAAGRLIRKADDTGVLILADRRLVTKRYGKAFLNSLQSKTVRICPTREIVAALAAMNGRRL